MKSSIFLFGENNLQNQLLELYIEEKLRIVCNLVTDFSKAPSITKTEKKGFSLVLWDCSSISLDIFGNGAGKFFYFNFDYYLALLNVESKDEIDLCALGKKVRGIFFKKDTLEIVEKGIKSLLNGKLWFSREIMSSLLLECSLKESKNDIPKLTAREKQILGTIGLGLTNKEISEKLCISDKTVKTHIYNIFQKIKVTNRLQAAIWATKHL